MPYEPTLDVVQILRSTLYLLEQSQFPQKGSPTIEAVVLHLRQALADLEAPKRPPATETEDAADEKADSA